MSLRRSLRRSPRESHPLKLERLKQDRLMKTNPLAVFVEIAQRPSTEAPAPGAA